MGGAHVSPHTAKGDSSLKHVVKLANDGFRVRDVGAVGSAKDMGCGPHAQTGSMLDTGA
jgi:hypothetical protein